jgi:hypothetical protein
MVEESGQWSVFLPRYDRGLWAQEARSADIWPSSMRRRNAHRCLVLTVSALSLCGTLLWRVLEALDRWL